MATRPGPVPVTAAVVAGVLLAALGIVGGPAVRSTIGAGTSSVSLPGTGVVVAHAGDAGTLDAAGAADGAVVAIVSGVPTLTTVSTGTSQPTTLSVSSTANGNGSASATTSSITLTLPTGQAAASRAVEPAAVLASTGVVSSCDVAMHLVLTDSTAAQGAAVSIGDDGGSGAAGVGGYLALRLATNGAWDLIRTDGTAIASNYSANALPRDVWVRFVTLATGRVAFLTGTGASLDVVDWTVRHEGTVTAVPAMGTRNNIRAAIYTSSGTAPTDITASVSDITWTAL